MRSFTLKHSSCSSHDNFECFNDEDEYDDEEEEGQNVKEHEDEDEEEEYEEKSGDEGDQVFDKVNNFASSISYMCDFTTYRVS